jgi:hypothetical protein
MCHEAGGEFEQTRPLINKGVANMEQRPQVF